MTNNKYSSNSNLNNANKSNQQLDKQNSRENKALDTNVKSDNQSIHKRASEMERKVGQQSPGNPSKQNQNNK